MSNEQQKGIDEAPVVDHPEQPAAGLQADEVVDSLKGMREAPTEGTAQGGEPES